MQKKISALIIDERLTELRPINMFFVSRYRQAMRNGANFPPPIVEKGTGRVVSGKHRVSAYLEEFGADHQIDVVERKFKSESEVLRLFAEENSKHGNPLSGYSMKYITQRLLSLGDTPEEIASALNIPVKKVQDMGGMSVFVIGNGKKEKKPIKHGLEHKAGSNITEADYTCHQRQDRGVPARNLATQLTRWIENDWIDKDDDATVTALRELHAALDKVVAAV